MGSEMCIRDSSDNTISRADPALAGINVKYPQPLTLTRKSLFPKLEVTKKVNTQAMITGEIKSQVDKIWEAFWTGGISNPLTVIEQFTYLLFLRRLDERQQLEEKKANLIGVEVESPIYKPEYKKLRWNSFKDEDPEALFALFTQPQKDMDDLTAFELMKQLGTKAGVCLLYTSPSPRDGLLSRMPSSA